MLREALNKNLIIFLNSFLDFLFPTFCCSCKIRLAEGNLVCSDCLSKIQRADEDRLKHEFERKFSSEKIISDFRAVFIFEKDKEFQHIIHALKYNGKFAIGTLLGKIVACELRNHIKLWEPDLIIPVPLHTLKKAERGYNQSYFIAKGIKSILDIPIASNILKRKKYTQSQTTMTLIERKENIDGAFAIRKHSKIAGKKIILLDDVITTGATISECGRALLAAGAEKVFALSTAVAD